MSDEHPLLTISARRVAQAAARVEAGEDPRIVVALVIADLLGVGCDATTDAPADVLAVLVEWASVLAVQRHRGLLADAVLRRDQIPGDLADLDGKADG